MSLQCPVCGETIDFISPDGSAVCPSCNTFIDPPGQSIDEVVHAPTAQPKTAAPRRPALSPLQRTYRFTVFILGIGVLGLLLFLGGAIAGDGTPFGLAIFSISFVVAVVAIAAFFATLIQPEWIEEWVHVGLTRLNAVVAFLPIAAAAAFVAYKTYSP